MMWSDQLAGNAALRLDEVMTISHVKEGQKSLDASSQDFIKAQRRIASELVRPHHFADGLNRARFPADSW